MPIAYLLGGTDSEQCNVRPSSAVKGGTGFIDPATGMFVIASHDIAANALGAAIKTGRFKCNKQRFADSFQPGDRLSFDAAGVVAGTDPLVVLETSSAGDRFVIATLNSAVVSHRQFETTQTITGGGEYDVRLGFNARMEKFDVATDIPLPKNVRNGDSGILKIQGGGSGAASFPGWTFRGGTEPDPTALTDDQTILVNWWVDDDTVHATFTDPHTWSQGAILFLLGESNCEGQGIVADLPAGDQAAFADVFIWDGSNWSALDAGTNNEGATVAEFGPEVGIARKWQDKFPGIPLYIEKLGAQNSSVHDNGGNHWGPGGSIRTSVTTSWNNAKAAPELDGQHLPIFLAWVQGEADAIGSVNAQRAHEYEQHFQAMLDWILSDTGREIDGLALIRLNKHLDKTNWPHMPIVRAAQERLANSRKSWSLVSLDDMATEQSSDSILDTHGAYATGLRLATDLFDPGAAIAGETYWQYRGGTERIELPFAFSLSSTFEVIAYVNTVSTNQAQIVDGRDGPSVGPQLRLQASGFVLAAWSGVSVTSTVVINDGFTHKVRAWWDGANLQLEIDDADTQSASLSSVGSITTNAKIGQRSFDLVSETFEGIIHDIKITLDGTLTYEDSKGDGTDETGNANHGVRRLLERRVFLPAVFDASP